MVVKGNRGIIDSQSYKENDRELSRVYANVNSMSPRDMDYAPTGFSSEYEQRMKTASDAILNIYGQSGGGKKLDPANRYAVDALIAYGRGIDISEAERQHDKFITMFAGDNLEDKSFVEAFGDMWESYSLQKELASLMNEFDDSEDEEEKNRLNLEMMDLEREMIKHQDYSKRSWLSNATIQAAPIANQLVRQLAYTAAGALIGAGVGGLASGTITSAKATGSIAKGLGMLRSSTAIAKGAKAGWMAGEAANAVINVYGVEKGAFSRELYNMVDADGNRLSDAQRDMMSRAYALIATAIEFATPEPGISELIRSGAVKDIVGDTIKDTIFNIARNAAAGAISESTEEMLQAMVQEVAKNIALQSSNNGNTNFDLGSMTDRIAGIINSGIDAFKETFGPSFIIGGVSGAGMASISAGSRTLIKELAPGKDVTSDEVKVAEAMQDHPAGSTAVPIRMINRKRGKPSKDYLAPDPSQTGNNATAPKKVPVINVRKDKSNKQWNQKFEPVSADDQDALKFLFNKGAKTVFVRVQQDDVAITTDDLRNSSSIHNGFFDEDTGNIYTSTVDDADAIVAELGASVVKSERIDDNTLSVTYRNEDGQEVTMSIITDQSLADVLTLNEEAENVATAIDEVEQEGPAVDPAVVTEVNAQADSWTSRPKEWIQSSEFTKDMAGAIRKAPSEARAVLDKGLATYIRSVNPGMDETQVEAMADANAVLMMHLANAQGRDIADFVEGITSLGITGDNSVRGQYRENAGSKSIVLNPAKMEPLTFSHEVGHYFLQTLPDGELKNRIISTYSKQYNADGRKIGKNLHEAFVKGLTNFMATGQAENAEIRSVFQKLVSAMKAFIDRAKSGLTKKQIALYNSMFQQSQIESSSSSNTLSKNEAKELISRLERTAEDYVPIPFSEENAGSVFSTNIMTPVGEIKFGEHQSLKLENLKRTDFLGMIRPTLETPSLILREEGRSDDGQDAFEFYKVFKNKEDSTAWFVSVAVHNSEVDGLVVISSRRSNERQLEGRLMKFPLAYNVAAETQQTGNDGQRQRDISSRLNSNLSSDQAPVNDGDLILNEDVDNLTDEQKALRARIQRGRRAQGQRRSRFFQDIQEMLDNDLYVDTDDLLSAKRNLEQQMQEANTDAFKPVDFSENPEWVKICNELTMRDKMLLYPKEYLEVARGDKSRAEFIEYVRVNSPDPSSFSEMDRRTAEKYYNYVNTPSARSQVQAFVDEYSSLPRLMALKQILGPRRVAAQSQSGRVYTRQYVPTSNVWKEISSLSNDSSAAEVQAVLDSIQSNPDEWYQAYLNVLISSAKLGRESVEDTQTNLEAIAMSYYAGKRATGRETFFEKLTARGSESDTDIKKVHDAIDPSTEEGRAAGSIRRGDTFSDTYIEDVVPRITKEVQLEKDRARARESIGRSERAIRRMSNVNLANTDARFLPVSQWLYSFMHGGRTGIFAELAGSDADIYQDIMEGKESPDSSTGQKTLYTFYPDLEPSAEGDPIVPLTYAEYDPYRTVEGFTVDLGGYRFDQKEIPAELKRFLPEDTVDHILSVEKWNDLTAEDIANIADAMKRAKRWAQDIQEEKRRQRTARDRNKSLPVAERLLGKTLQFTDDQLNEIGMKALGLNGKATPQEALDYYRKNPARLLDLYDDQSYDTKGGKILKSLRDRKDDAYLGFIKIQRLARALDGEDNGPIFNMFYRDIFEGYSEMKRQITRRNEEAAKAFAPVLGDHANPNLTSEQKKAEKAKFEKFSEMMNQTVELTSSSNLTGERNTRKLNGYDLLHLYLASKNINGFKKLIDPNKGSGLSLEAIMDYNPESVHEFVDLELRLRELIIKERNRINGEWNGTQLKRMEEDPDYVPQFRSTNLTWDDVKVAYGQKSFIKDRSTADLERILAESATKESLLNKDIKYIGDKMLELLAKETPRVVTADYQQRNELMTIERNYWPLVNRLRSPGSMLDLFEEGGGNKATPSAGFTKNRETESRYDILSQNPFAIFYTAIDQQERFINLGDTMKTIDNMWGPHGGNVSEIVERKYGSKMKQYLYNYFRRMAGKDNFNELIGLESLSALLPRLQGSYIGLSPLTTVRQYVSLINVMSRGEVKTRDLLSSTARFISNEAYREEVSERIKALAPELYETDITQEIAFQRHMEKMQFKSDTKSAQFRDFCTSWIRYHDRVTKWVTWETVFEQARAEGMSEADAAFKASTTVQETMSVGDPISRSQLQEDKNPLLRYLFMFTTDLFNTWNILFGDAISDWKQGDKMRAMKRLGGFVAMSAALAIIQGGWLPDDDDDEGSIFDLSGFWGDMSQELVNGVPIAGVFLSDLLSGYKGSQIPVVSDVLRDANNLFGEDKTAGERIDALVDAMITAGAPFGAPTSSARRMVNVVYTPDGGFFFNPLAFLNNNYANWYEHLFD